MVADRTDGVGAGKVIAIDRFPDQLRMASEKCGSVT